MRILYVALTRARDRLIVSEGAGTAGWSSASAELHRRRRVVAFRRRRAALRLSSNAMARASYCVTPIARRVVPARTVVSDARAAQARNSPTSPVADSPLRPGATGDLMISPTALADFDRCPRQYWLRHGLGLPERSFEPERAAGRTPPRWVWSPMRSSNACSSGRAGSARDGNRRAGRAARRSRPGSRPTNAP